MLLETFTEIYATPFWMVLLTWSTKYVTAALLSIATLQNLFSASADNFFAEKSRLMQN